MKEKTLGRTELLVKTLGFGGIPIQRVSEEEAIAVVRRCYELGLNYYDTARNYSNSEQRIGKALEDVRENVIYATKSHQKTANGIRKELAISLKNLRTDYIDIYQLHNVTTEEQWKQVREPGGAVEAVNEAKESGKIRHISVTSHNPDLAIKLVKSNLFSTLMIPYNYLALKPQEKLLPLCNKLNVGTIIMKPFGGGAFSNANTALKFVYNNPNVDIVIPGVPVIAELEENYRVWLSDLTISDEEKELIEKDRVELGKNYCRGCGYCQPCPQEISISFILRAEKQTLRRMGWSEGRVNSLKNAFAKAKTCIKCGECESRCPYELPIMELIPESVERLKVHMKNQTVP